MMQKQIIRNDSIRETIVAATHESGLRVFLVPKPEYTSAYAIFGTKYGSIDTKFRVDGGNMVEVPEGIAHYLEHKLFESEDGDAFTRYAKTGASANAYTSFDRTCYLFSCSEQFKESLDILLDFVQSPYFTAETVAKEQGIIGQEIRMYDDSPSWRVLFNMLEAMYENHPVRIDIAGTVESISHITADLLYTCYNAFYNLNNMFICIAGNVDPDQVLAQIESGLKPVRKVTVERGSYPEPDGVKKHYVSQQFPITMPMFCLGFKEKCDTPQRSLKETLSMEVLLELLVGPTSPLYERLIDQGLINTNFDSEYFTGHGYAAPIFSGESFHAQEVAEAILAEANRLRTEGIDEALFRSICRGKYGRAVMSFNHVESIVSGLVEAAMQGTCLFDDFELLHSLTVDDVAQRLSVFRPECMVLSVVEPQAQPEQEAAS